MVRPNSDWLQEELQHIVNRCREVLRDPAATTREREISGDMLAFYSDIEDRELIARVNPIRIPVGA